MTICDDTQADSLLEGLVAQYSPSTQERPAVEYLADRMEALGFRASIDGAGNAVGEIGEGERLVLLLGHIDTVPGFIDVRRKGSLLYGRGAVDAKGPLATFVAAAVRAGACNGKQIVVVGAVEEEAATSKGARFLLDKLAPDAVIIGEPSQWDCVTTGYKGRLLAQYTLSREIGHTARPDASACEEAFAFWRTVTEHAAAYNATHSRIFDQLTPSLRETRSDDDEFVQTATLRLSFRLPPSFDTDALETTLRDLAGDAHVSFGGREIAYHAAKNTPLARAFVKAIDAEGGRIQFKVKSGTSDMNVVGPVWNCPILAYGPGDSALDHTPHEHIDLREYHKSIAVLTHVLQIL
jgi:LysW-gamma-L-lysine carboxypeptidase